MSRAKYFLGPHLPITQKEHRVEDCSSPMSCKICMHRCYDSWNWIFENIEKEEDQEEYYVTEVRT